MLEPSCSIFKWYLITTVLMVIAVSLSIPRPSSLHSSSFDLVGPSSLNETLTGGRISCQVPIPHPPAPVNIQSCYSVFAHMLNDEHSQQPITYTRDRSGPIPISRAPCAISIDGAWKKTKLTISKRRIVAEAQRILQECKRWGEGGWAWIDEGEDWIVIVNAVVL